MKTLWLGAMLAAIALVFGRPVVTQARSPQPPVALITGADRGIGFALTRELTARGWKVLATCRDPVHAMALNAFAASHSSVRVETLDVANNASIDALSHELRDQPIDALIDNAGITGDFKAQRLATLGVATFQKVMRVNAYAPLRVAQAFLDQVAASRQKKIIAISSGSGSLELAPHLPDSYFYSMSKAALNMGMRLLQNDVRSRGILIGIVRPGMVDTDMQRQARAAAAEAGKRITAPTITPAAAARELVNYIESLGPATADRFYDGPTDTQVPW
jgi:NAD(P)-dependent dehydrogenase (short-subunit alcohol dehydrogenase family)